MLTPFVLSSAVGGGSLVLATPLAFSSLLALRYPERRTTALGHADVDRGEETADNGAADQAVSVIGPERLERLRASRERLRTSADLDRAA